MITKRSNPKLSEIDVTPDVALDMLTRNETNRNVSPKHVAMLAKLMMDGDFHYVGDPIRFDVDGKLLDGQHRLSAIVESETTQRMAVITGLPRESQLYLDQGRKRSPGDQLKLQLGVRNGNVAAAIVRLWLQWTTGNLLSVNRTFSLPELVAWAEDNMDLLDEATRRGAVLRNHVPGASATVGGTAFMGAMAVHQGQAREFWDRLLDGVDLSADSPIRALRETIMRRAKIERWNRAEELDRYVRAWNAWRKGQPLTKIQTSRNGITAAKLIMR